MQQSLVCINKEVLVEKQRCGGGQTGAAALRQLPKSWINQASTLVKTKIRVKSDIQQLVCSLQLLARHLLSAFSSPANNILKSLLICSQIIGYA